jgi:hypothetical protein
MVKLALKNMANRFIMVTETTLLILLPIMPHEIAFCGLSYMLDN